jgi:S-adenosylmethionine hydrolase
MPIVTLTTDFGVRDPWVGVMKGVVLGIAPEVRLVDLSHEVARHDVLEAALVLEAAVPFFPDGSIHVAVVDPGVGGPRRGLVIAASRQRFVGPDNGVFTPVLLDLGWEAFELTAPEYRLAEVGATFHGRDVFAPAAAHLARGAPPERFGRPVEDPVRLAWPAARRTADGVTGEVVHVDRFGNLVTSIRMRDLPPDPMIEVGGRSLPLVHTYGSAATGALVGLVGSSGRLEVAVREGNAARILGVGRGTAVAAISSSSRSSPRTEK